MAFCKPRIEYSHTLQLALQICLLQYPPQHPHPQPQNLMHYCRLSLTLMLKINLHLKEKSRCPNQKGGETQWMQYVILPRSLCAETNWNSCQHWLTKWINFQTAFLDEALCYDGLGNFLGHMKCSSCRIVEGVIKCKDYSCRPMLKCTECIISLHQALPLHHVEVGTSV